MSGALDANNEALLAQARRLGLVWELQPATVDSTPTDLMNVQISMDGDLSGVVSAISLIGALTATTRVMVMIVPPQGNYIIGFYGQAGPS